MCCFGTDLPDQAHKSYKGQRLSCSEQVAPVLHAIDGNADTPYFIERYRFVGNQRHRTIMVLTSPLELCSGTAYGVEIVWGGKSVKSPLLSGAGRHDTGHPCVVGPSLSQLQLSS